MTTSSSVAPARGTPVPAPACQPGRPVRYAFHPVSRCNMCGSSGTPRVLGRRLNTRQGFWPRGKVGVATTIVQCRQCRLIYPNPMPVPERVEDLYDLPPESYWTEDYFATAPDHLRHQVEVFERLYGRKARGLTALEVGAGVGKSMVALGRAGFDVFGIEPSVPFHARAIDRTGIPPDRLRLATVEACAFPEASFDFVNLSSVLEHLYDPSAVLGRALTWLKPGGLIHVEVPSAHYLMSRLMRLFYRATGGDYVINLAPMHPPFHLYEFSPLSFRENARRGGYEVVFHEYSPCESWAPGPLKPLFHAAMAATSTGMELAVWLRKTGPGGAGPGGQA